MIYFLLDANAGRDLIRRGFIPRGYLEKLNELYIFGERDSQNKTIAVAVFGDCPDDKSAVRLMYIYVHEDFRGDHHAVNIFKYARDTFSSIGIEKIYCDTIVEKNKSKEQESFILSLGFSAIYTDIPVLRFKRGHFIGDKVDMLYKNLNRLRVKIDSIEDYNDKRLRQFLEENRVTGINISKEEYDPRLCAFGFKDDTIVAALVLKKIDVNGVISEKFYVSDELGNKDYILPFMLAYVSKKSESYYEEIMYIYAVFEKEYRKEAVLTTFGKGTIEYCKQRYRM